MNIAKYELWMLKPQSQYLWTEFCVVHQCANETSLQGNNWAKLNCE